MPRSDDYFVQPKDFRFGTFQNDRGRTLRYGQMKSTTGESRGTLVIGPGYGEAIEKFFELIDDMTTAGYDVYIMDWMGQGGSERTDKNDPQKPYDVKNFVDHHRDDLHLFVTKIMQVPDTHKIGYLGFSMGAHIGMRFFEQYDYIFDAATFNAGLFDIGSGRGLPRSLVPAIAKTLQKSGKGKDYARGGGPWSSVKQSFNENSKTSDPRRYRRLIELYENKVDIQIGDVTVDWVCHLLPSLAQANKKDTLAKIMTPIQMAISEKDTTVSVPAQKRALGLLGNAKGITYPLAKHEIWIERDSVRDPWLFAMKRFLLKQFEKEEKPVRFQDRLPRKNLTYKK